MHTIAIFNVNLSEYNYRYCIVCVIINNNNYECCTQVGTYRPTYRTHVPGTIVPVVCNCTGKFLIVTVQLYAYQFCHILYRGTGGTGSSGARGTNCMYPGIPGYAYRYRVQLYLWILKLGTYRWVQLYLYAYNCMHTVIHMHTDPQFVG